MPRTLWCVDCGTAHMEPITNQECIKCKGHVFSDKPPDTVVTGEVVPPQILPGEPETAEEKPVERVEAEVVDAEAESRERVQQARSLVPVNLHGPAPADLQGQITYAQEMCKTGNGVPAHLRRNVGACMAVVDIAQRAGLSPFMVANLSYVKDDKAPLSFMSQLWHALLEQSGKLNGALKQRFEGEGENRVCIVYGKIKGDDDVLEWRSPPLKDLHPGYTTKNGIKYVKGSPLWDDKPDVQLTYDTKRDWIRIYCPLAVAGIPIDDQPAPTSGPEPGLLDRLQTADRSNGHREGHGDRELAAIGAVPDKILPAEPEGKRKKRKRKAAPPRKAKRKRARR